MNNSSPQTWYLYMIRCNDGSLYTGITLDLVRRFCEHQKQGPKCAKYLRSKQPLAIVYGEEFDCKQDALRAEIRIKKLSKLQKELLVIDFSKRVSAIVR